MRFIRTIGKLPSYSILPTGITTVLSELLNEKQKELEPHFKPDLLQRNSTVFQFRFTTDEDFFLSVSQKSFIFSEGSASNPTLTLYLDHHETCWQLLMGTRDGMDAFMNGQYRADGNIVLSQLLLYLFKSADPIVAFKVQD
jgi:putative sterol carrier protein